MTKIVPNGTAPADSEPIRNKLMRNMNPNTNLESSWDQPACGSYCGVEERKGDARRKDRRSEEHVPLPIRAADRQEHARGDVSTDTARERPEDNHDRRQTSAIRRREEAGQSEH